MRNPLRDEILLQLEFLGRTVVDAEELLSSVDPARIRSYEKAAAAHLLSQFYNGIENILTRNCKGQGIALPSGEHSHAELFGMFCRPDDERIPVLFPEDQ